MKPEDRFLFLVTRQNLTGYHRSTMLALASRYRLGWNSIFWAAEKYGVAPLVFVNISRHPELVDQIPPELLERYRQYSLRQAFVKAKRDRILQEGLEYFHQRSIQVLLIKGAALDWLVYDQPWYTVSKDIDIILSAKKDDLTPDQIHEIENHFYEKGVEYDFFEHHDMNMNGILPLDFGMVWRDSRVRDYRGQEIRVLSPEDMLLSICVNSCRKRFFYLKSLCDIAETIQESPEIDWANFIQRSIDFGCNNLVYSALLVTQRTLGCPVPDEILKRLSVHPFRSLMIQNAVAFSMRQLSLVNSTLVPDFRVLGRRVDRFLFLTYSTYTPNQIKGKMKEIRQAGK